MRILVLDVGGTHVKALATGRRKRIEFESGPKMTPSKMVAIVKEATAVWKYEVVSIGYPGVVVHDRPIIEPRNLGPGWVGFDFKKAFGKPIKIVNDAAMQALGEYKSGRMLFLGLGTGLGSAMVFDHVLEPMELGHLPFKKGRTFEEYVGLAGLERLGKKKWLQLVNEIAQKLKNAVQADYVVLGGGNARLLTKLPPKFRLGDNSNAFQGGYRLWRKINNGSRSQSYVH